MEYPHGDKARKAKSRLWYSSRIYHKCLYLRNPAWRGCEAMGAQGDPHPLLCSPCRPRPEHPITPSLPGQDYEKSPAGASHKQRHTTPLPTASDAAPPGVGGSRFALRLCLLQGGKEGITSAFVQLARPQTHQNCPKWPWTSLIATVHKRCLKLTFVYFTLMTAKEHTRVVSTQAKFSQQFSCVHHLLL